MRGCTEIDIDNINWILGGTIIGTKYVLSAAHCFLQTYGWMQVENLGVISGTKYKDGTGGDRYDVDTLHKPNNFNFLTFENDIAVLKVYIINELIHNIMKYTRFIFAFYSKFLNKLMSISKFAS